MEWAYENGLVALFIGFSVVTLMTWLITRQKTVDIRVKQAVSFVRTAAIAFFLCVLLWRAADVLISNGIPGLLLKSF